MRNPAPPMARPNQARGGDRRLPGEREERSRRGWPMTLLGLMCVASVWRLWYVRPWVVGFFSYVRGNEKIMSRWQQQCHALQPFVRQRVPRALMMVALLGWGATWGIAGFGVTYAQAPASPPYISSPVKPLPVKVPPTPPAKPTAPAPPGPIVTVPEGEPLPTEPPPPRRPIRDPVIQTDERGPAQKQKRE
jgi:hypothetical protein